MGALGGGTNPATQNGGNLEHKVSGSSVITTRPSFSILTEHIERPSPVWYPNLHYSESQE